ncbi:MAG: IscS subfamily cysteine desulfurase, partial [Bacteroidota bacterium]
ACTSASIDPSHVLLAMGLDELNAFSCIRFTLGKFNNPEEIPLIVESVKNNILRLRKMVT